MNTKFAYDRMDYYSILEYLKSQAEYFSEGRWTDFTDADIGTVLLKLMAMNADTTNFQIEKGVSELYLDTVVDRVNAISLCKLIGYEPRHYQSAVATITAEIDSPLEQEIEIPAFTNMSANSTYSFYTIDKVSLNTGLTNFKVYEGKYTFKTYLFSDINQNGQIILPDYDIGTNTIVIEQAGHRLTMVKNALYGEGELCYSIHTNLNNQLYIQFPTYYMSILSTTTPINVYYLLSSGVDGRVGAQTLVGKTVINDTEIRYYNEYASEGGYNPESVEEIRKEAPAFASTMDTLVTLNDFRILSKDFDGIADIVALDYNYPESGLIQPTDDTVNDAYKVNLYILPSIGDSIYKEATDGDFTGMHVINLDDINIEESPYEYEFNYNSTDGYFFNTNTDVPISSCITTFTVNNAWKQFAIKYEMRSEVNTSLFTVYKDGEAIIADTGESSGYIILDNTDEYMEITLDYSKNNVRTYENDIVKVYLYATNDDADIRYTDEYLDVVKEYSADVKKKKPAGIMTYFLNVNYIKPTLSMKVYMDEDDLRYNSASTVIANYLEELYSRENYKIGDPIFQSHIAKDIISKFEFVKYLEIVDLEYSVDGAIKPNNTEYVELLAKNINIQLIPYER